MVTLRFYSSLVAGAEFFSGCLADVLQSTPTIKLCGCLQWRAPRSTSETALVLKLIEEPLGKHSEYGFANECLGLEELIKGGRPELQSLL